MRTWTYSVMGMAAVALGCAGEAAGPDSESAASLAQAGAGDDRSRERPYRPGEMPVGGEPTLGNERDSDVKLGFEKGYLNQNEVNEIIEKHVATLTACYERAGTARKYAAGAVRLRFLVG